MSLPSRRALAGWAAMALLLLLAVACRRAPLADEAPEVQVTLAADPATAVVGPLRFDVTLVDASGAPIDDATVTLRGDMSHAGMEPVLATAVAQGQGRYSADFAWTMAGDWVVTVQVTLPDGRVKIAQFPYGVQPN